MSNKYVVNYKEYCREELIAHAQSRLSSDLSDWERDLFDFILNWVSLSSTISIHTSGSTGKPKEIQISKERMIRSAERTLRYFEVKPSESILLCLPVKYIAGMMMVVRAFTGSLNLITLPPHQLQLGNIKGEIGFAALVPLQMDKLLNEHQDIASIRKIILGGSLVSPMLEEKLKGSFPGRIWETYGMTETITHVAVREINGAARIFNALPEISFSTDDRECLIISDPGILDEPLYTNDRVELLSETSFRLLGRIDHVINSGGIKVQPEVLESLIAPYILGRFCITSLPDETLGEMIVLVVEKGVDLVRVREGIDALESYHRPKKVFELEQIPVNRNGKIDYKELKDNIGQLAGN